MAESDQLPNVHLLVTNGAPNIKKASSALQFLYSNNVHVTYLAHEFHRVSENVRNIYPEV